MMKWSEKLTERVFSLVSRVFRNAVMGAVMGMAVMAPAFAASGNNNKTLPTLEFSFHQNGMFSPSYPLARQAMDGMYKKAQPNDTTRNPLIGIVEWDLDGDGMPEIIAKPTEEMEETGLFCTRNGLCPHYILQVRGKELHTLGIIWADEIALDKPENGFWTIRAYTQKRGGGNGYETYIYDKKSGQFARQGAAVEPLPAEGASAAEKAPAP